MIDLILLRENPDVVIQSLQKKDPSYDVEKLITLDKELRFLRSDVESLRAEKNEIAKQGRGGITPQLREKSSQISEKLKIQEKKLEFIKHDFQSHYLSCPNILDDSVPAGNVESNVLIKKNGTKLTYNFPLKNHAELGSVLGWLDFETATRLAGSNFALYKGDGVKLLYALAMFMLKHNNAHGFDFVLPSVLVNEQSLEVTGNFPKFKDQAFAVPHDDLYLTPTSEVNLTNMYRNHIFAKDDLPVRMTAFTSCFRREGGGYGATERGLIRMRQFEK